MCSKLYLVLIHCRFYVGVFTQISPKLSLLQNFVSVLLEVVDSNCNPPVASTSQGKWPILLNAIVIPDLGWAWQVSEVTNIEVQGTFSALTFTASSKQRHAFKAYRNGVEVICMS